MPTTIIMPIHDGETTLEGVFRRLDAQRHKELVDRIILIDDASRDSTPTILRDYAARSPYRVDIVTHAESHGLAASYNEGIRLCASEYFLLMHDDVEISGDEAFPKMLAPFAADPRTVVTYPTVTYPMDVWVTYEFWQKVLFSRWVGRRDAGIYGKFDCYLKKAFEARAGSFNQETYRTAGEDIDCAIRLTQAGPWSVLAPVEVVHVHSRATDFGISRFIRKENQLSDAYGVLLRRHPGYFTPRMAFMTFRRHMLVIGLLVPGLRLVAGVLMVVYAYVLSAKARAAAGRKPPLPVVLAVITFMMLTSTAYAVRGFVIGRQRL